MEINSDLVMQYGLMSKLSTGHALLDALLVMLVPLLVNRLLPQLHTFVQQLFSRPAPPEQTHERIIIHKQNPDRNWWYSADDDEHPNHKLQQAIIVYLNMLPSLFSQLESCDVQLCKAKRKPAAAAGSSEGSSGSAGSGDGSFSSEDDWYPGMELEQYEVKMVPPCDTWISIEPGLSFKRSENREGSEKESHIITSYMLVGKTAAQVDGWISKAYDACRGMLRGEQAASKADRYLYLPVLQGGEGDGEALTYRRYKLSDDKTFDNLFHADKDELLKLVDTFMTKRGKFAIKGYPHKLGFLLHGPPGTGKTSFIKALACHMRRSIINIPLNRIKTNQQLMDMMFDQRVQVKGEDLKVPLPFSKTIFVMEDVDAASHVVRKRESGGALAATLASLMGGGAKSKAGAAGKDAAAATTAADVEATSPDDANTAAAADTAAAAAEGAEVAGPAPAPGKASAATAAWLAGAAGMGLGMGGAAGGDALNLAGLLNVLDGVVDTPGRLIVMSTNHPEKLDPALIRPGRINKKVYMGNLAAAEALAMVRHYFESITQRQQQQLLDSWVNGVVSPAALEALCAEHEEVDGLLTAAQQLLSGMLGHSRKMTGYSMLQQQQQVKQEKKKEAERQVPAAAAACCEGSAGPGSSCVMIRASSCAASFAAGSCGSSSSTATVSSSPFAGAVSAYQEHS